MAEDLGNPHDDWPEDNEEIDLTRHDLPHPSSNIEWWYCNSHLTDTQTNDSYSVFASFFRTVDNYHSTPGDVHHLHALTWAIIDVKNERYYSSTLIDNQAVSRLLDGVELYKELDKNLFHAYQEVLKKNRVPLPDRLAKRPCFVDATKLSLNYDNNQFYKDDHGDYNLICDDPDRRISLHLKMKAVKHVSRQGNNGIIENGSNGEAMFYYFIPRLACAGQLVVQDRTISVHGQAWYDHEFGGLIKYYRPQNVSSNSNEKNDSSRADFVSHAWYWFGIQLDNDYDLSISQIFNAEDQSILDEYILFVGPNDESVQYHNKDEEYQFGSNQTWMSSRTGSIYPTHFHLIVPQMQCQLDLRASFNDQELITILSRPAFWEGRIDVVGQIKGQPVRGTGFFECHGMNMKLFKPLDSFFKRMGALVSKNIQTILPRDLSLQHAIDLFVNQEYSYLIQNVDLNIVSQTIITPLRDLLDRGGKAWRPYLLLVCIDCVGGDSRKYIHWTSLAEIFHVGSLIIDDIQDQSEIRRGGPACHLIHGTAHAINAGTSAYFLPMYFLMQQTSDLTPDLKLQIYETTYLTFRAAHLGQALDIYGLDYLMNEVVKTGHSTALEQAVLSIHRLKSGVPAGCLARIGAIIGGASQEQYQALEQYVQSLGVAFQIIDDVLNLRGFDKESKRRGEDLMVGKITYPVAKAMNERFLVDVLQREYVWETIKLKTKDTTVIDKVIDMLEECGAIEQSIVSARDLVEDAWLLLNPLIPDSFFKLILRAFGFHILERHY